MTAAPIRQSSDDGGCAAAAEALAAGSVVAVPTDTVYGLAVLPSVAGTVERLFLLKGRPKDVAVPMLVATWHQAEEVAGPWSGPAEQLAVRYWPGPLTLVVHRADGFSADLGGPATARKTVGVRWPDHPVVGRLGRELGPLAVTSANLHGSPPASTADEVAAVFSGLEGLALILDGGTCDGLPSTVVECLGPDIRCLREGAIRWDEIVEPPLGESPPDGS